MQLKNNRGFTLIELLLALTIGAILIVVTATACIRVVSIQKNVEELGFEEDLYRRLFYYFTFDIKSLYWREGASLQEPIFEDKLLSFYSYTSSGLKRIIYSYSSKDKVLTREIRYLFDNKDNLRGKKIITGKMLSFEYFDGITWESSFCGKKKEMPLAIRVVFEDNDSGIMATPLSGDYEK